MTQPEYFAEFEALCKEELELTRLKNGDYAQPEDAFANFRLIEEVTQGRISLEDGILCRITDKLKRVGGLLKNPALVKEESLEDNLKDIAVYAKIWRIYRRSQSNKPKIQSPIDITDKDCGKYCGTDHVFHYRCTLSKNHPGACFNSHV